MAFDRRTVVLGGAALASMAATGASARPARAGKLDRIAISSPSFRHLFKRSNPKAVEPIVLADFPSFVRSRLGLRNVELWSLHFDANTPEYCRSLRAAAQSAGARIINLQLDDPTIDLSHPEAATRDAAIGKVKAWMDRASLCGAPSLRTNVNILPPKHTVELPRVIDSFRTLAQYGRSIGVKILVENHVGYTASVDTTVAVVRGVNDPWCRAIADWGNSPATDDAGRLAAIGRLMPLTDLVSAKGVEFDTAGRHLSYNQAALVRAAEAAGYKGLYSVELYGPKAPVDSIAAARSVIETVATNLRRA